MCTSMWVCMCVCQLLYLVYIIKVLPKNCKNSQFHILHFLNTFVFEWFFFFFYIYCFYLLTPNSELCFVDLKIWLTGTSRLTDSCPLLNLHCTDDAALSVPHTLTFYRWRQSSMHVNKVTLWNLSTHGYNKQMQTWQNKPVS